MGLTLNSTIASLPESLKNPASNQPAKTGLSKFDAIRQKLSDSDQNKASVEALDRGKGQSAGLSQAVPNARTANSLNLSRLQQADTSSKTTSTPKIVEALAGLENQYAKLDSILKGMPHNATPQQLIALQQKVDDIGESVGVLSKLVDQATSTTKTIFQTQI